MKPHRIPAVTAAGSLLAASIGLTWVVLRATGLRRYPPDLAFDDLMTAAGAWLLLGCAGWSVLICGAAALEAVTEGRLRATRWVACPPTLRRALLAGLGVALVTTPVQAQTVHASRATAAKAPTRTTTPEPGLPVPERPLGGASRPALVVRPGDNLWRLAETHLPDSARAPEIAQRVEILHRTNRKVIGPDPDLILPGQRLVVPTPGSHQPREESR